MDDRTDPSATHGFLGIEAGGTRTSACWMNAPGKVQPPVTFGPANLKLLTDPQLRDALRDIARVFPRPSGVGIGMAGARTAGDRQRIAAAATQVWPGCPLAITHDLEIALSAAGPRPDHPRILVLAGTGSCCYGQDAHGQTARVGGWGHLLGDQGSGYDVAVQALRQVVETHDQTGRWSPLGASILARLHLHEPDQLVGWIHGAPKGEVAALAPVVFEAASLGNRIARGIVRQAADSLTRAAIACACRLTRRSRPVEFCFAGGVLLGQPSFATFLARRLRTAWPGAIVSRLPASGAVGAAHLAREAWRSAPAIPAPKTPPDTRPVAPDRPRRSAFPVAIVPEASGLSPTERRHPDSMHLDRLSPGKAIELMLREDARLPGAILREKREILKALRHIHRALASGHRLFYVGAGTSGRLGILDASECPPTFRTPPDWVQGIIAGGSDAVFRAVEGAEDDVAAGRRAIEFRGIGPGDVVLGIAASGRTPFVWGALAAARERGAIHGLLCFHPDLKFAPGQRPDFVIAPRIGPEILTGSTRLKAGTATKLVLNLLTTLTMVRLGKVLSNLMVDLHPANAKLRDRAVRIVVELTGVPSEAARTRLEHHAWVVKDAVKSLWDARRTARPRSGQRQT